MSAIPMTPSPTLTAIWARDDRIATPMRTTPAKIKPSTIAIVQQYRTVAEETILAYE